MRAKTTVILSTLCGLFIAQPVMAQVNMVPDTSPERPLYVPRGVNTEPTNNPADAVPENSIILARTFVQRMSISDRFEIEAGKAAARISKDQNVRAFAQEMVEAHKQSSQMLKDVLTRVPVETPYKLDEKRSVDLAELKGLSGPKFDRVYIQSQVQAHKDAVETLRFYSQYGDTPELRQFAVQVLPIVEKHYAHATSLQTVVMTDARF